MLEDVPFRAIVDAAPDGMIMCDHAGTLVLVNAEAERMFGYDHDELLGKSIDVLVPDRVRGHHHHHVASYTAAPRLRPMGSNLDLHGKRKTGELFPVEISLSPLQSKTRGLMIIAGIRDVSDRRALERDNKRMTGFLMSAVEAVQDAFILFDEHDRVIMLNSAARLSAPEAPLIGRTFEDIVRLAIDSGSYDLKGEPPDSWLQRRLAYHKEPVGTLDVHTSRGRTVRVTERKTADRGTVLIAADVTDDVTHAVELESARSQAEAASAAKSEFLSSMSHELRTPLNAILGFAQLLERDRKQPLSERQLDRLSHVTRGGEHLLRLIDDVLDLSRIEAGRITISTEPVGLLDVIAEVLATLEPMAMRAGITLRRETPPHVPRVVADRTRLAQILMNFGSNSIKYGKQGGFVSIRIEERPEVVRVCVADDGIGIPVEKHDKVFEPFQRAGQETGPIEGTGIGLTISKRLAALMNGTIGFNSQFGQGSEFWIELPRLREAVTEREVVREQEQPTRLGADGKRRVVIYIEDNPSNIAFMRDFVSELPTIELLTAPTAELGIELVRAHQPAVVIMDINLPGMSGFEAVRRLREWPETKAIPVIGLSAAALAKDTARAKEAGFYRYLTKPVKVAELTAVLEELLQQ